MTPFIFAIETYSHRLTLNSSRCFVVVLTELNSFYQRAVQMVLFSNIATIRVLRHVEM